MPTDNVHFYEVCNYRIHNWGKITRWKLTVFVRKNACGIRPRWLNCSLSFCLWFSASIKFGVRQSSVLSPLLFAIYLDDIPIARSLVSRSFIVLYADDILLIAPSVHELQRLFKNCERELQWLDKRINEKKSCCLRIGPRFKVTVTTRLFARVTFEWIFVFVHSSYSRN